MATNLADSQHQMTIIDLRGESSQKFAFKGECSCGWQTYQPEDEGSKPEASTVAIVGMHQSRHGVSAKGIAKQAGSYKLVPLKGPGGQPLTPILTEGSTSASDHGTIGAPNTNPENKSQPAGTSTTPVSSSAVKPIPVSSDVKSMPTTTPPPSPSSPNSPDPVKPNTPSTGSQPPLATTATQPANAATPVVVTAPSGTPATEVKP